MKALYRKAFLKDLASIPAKTRSQIESFVFEDVVQAESVEVMGKVERMKGYPGFYKARFGDYRVGLRVEAGVVTFERVLHRKEIYRKFPD
ncbi:MAG TPA: type II toxin-antitoxin system RelE/ParE family toxin [Thermoanaerobaculia bacterium]|nr:type II toxin-antitoxin system RelE/ParE family toxin [Thermoanaerobaculia bacterium]